MKIQTEISGKVIFKPLEEIKGKRVLITGAAGTLGSALAQRCLESGVQDLYLLDIAESGLFLLEQKLNMLVSPKQNIHLLLIDIRDEERLENFFGNTAIDVLIHSAAYKHVPLMEVNPDVSVEVNLRATQALANLALAHQVGRFIFISTDKANAPKSVMGACKLAAEKYLSYLSSIHPESTMFISIRSGNILGSSGSVVPLFQNQIDHGGPLTVTHPDCTRYFISKEDATALILTAGLKLKSGRYFINIATLVKIEALAQDLIEASGKSDLSIAYIGLRDGERVHEQLIPEDIALSSTLLSEVTQIVDYGLENQAAVWEDLTYPKQNASNNHFVQFLMTLVEEYKPTQKVKKQTI